MIVKTQHSVVNRVYQASLLVDFDAQEARYSKAYGEPSVNVAGEIPYDAGDPPPPQDLVFDLEQDIGPAAVGGTAVYNSASQNWEIEAAGVLGVDQATVTGFHKGYKDVIADVILETQLDFIDELPVEGMAGDYLVGFCVLPGTDAANDLAGIFFGWGELGGVRGIWAFEKDKGGTGTVLGSLVPRSQPNGVYLRMVRVSADLTLSYSLNNGQTWSVLSTAELDAAAPRMGLFTSSGDNDAVVNALFSKIRSQTLPVPTPGTFVIQGGPTYELIRSMSPHVFQLDGKTDPEAQAKVHGWAAEIRSRIEVAKDELLANPDPGQNPDISYAQA